MPEWLYESGIGENRAILVDGDRIRQAAIEVPGETLVGAVAAGRVARIVDRWRHAVIATDRGEILVRRIPDGITAGQAVRIEIVREPLVEPGNAKRALGRITDAAERDPPALIDRIGAHSAIASSGPDRFEQAGWSDLVDEAVTGDIDFAGGRLRISLTPAMTLIDVDGWLTPAELAVAAAQTAAEAIERHDLGGSIGIDFPTLPTRNDRQRAAEAVDAHLPQPFERTAINGFGLMQIVRRRERQSLPELLRSDSAASAARALLRRAERVRGAGARQLIAAPTVIASLERRPEWLDTLRQRSGSAVRLQPEPDRPIWQFHVQAIQS